MINIIAAIARNNAIGFENKLLYWLPNDLRRFKALTTGHTIVMGRKTFESLPKGALPNRRNVVISAKGKIFEGAETFTSMDAAISSCHTDDEIFIIGGESIYRQALPIADRLCLTEIEAVPDNADAFFPEFNREEWQMESCEEYDTDEKHKQKYRFVNYIRK